MSEETLTQRQHREQGYREYTISNAALQLIAASGGDLVIKRSGNAAFTITDTADTDWLDGLAFEDVEPEA